jgi:hypothetical protein
MALIKIAPFYEGVFFMLAFRAFEAIRPPDVKEMFPAVFFCFETAHKTDEIHFLLLHSVTP